MPDDQISPELVLVDPELGQQARADLPWAAADVPWAEARPPAPTAASAPARLERPKTGLTIAATLWLFGAVAVALTLLVELLPDRGPRPTLAPASAPAPQPPRPTAPAASPSPPPAPAKPRARKAKPPQPAARPPAPRTQPPAPGPNPPAKRPSKPKAQSTPPPPPAAARPKPKPPPPPPAPQQQPRQQQQPPPPAANPTPNQQPNTQRRPPPPAAAKPPPPPPPRATPAPLEPARVFAWAPHPGASYYHVVIRRDGRVFYEGWPRLARLEIPGRFRFGPGEYTWRVEPGTGPRSAKRLGEPIVESSFTITG